MRSKRRDQYYSDNRESNDKTKKKGINNVGVYDAMTLYLPPVDKALNL